MDIDAVDGHHKVRTRNVAVDSGGWSQKNQGSETPLFDRGMAIEDKLIFFLPQVVPSSDQPVSGRPQVAAG